MFVEVAGRHLRAELLRTHPGLRPRYALTISNQTPLYLLVSFRSRRGGSDRPIKPGELWIDPQAQADLSFSISPLTSLLGGSLVVRLVNSRLQHELTAPLSGPSAVLAAAGGALAATLAALALYFLNPRVDVFAVPAVSAGASTLRVPYRTSGLGTPSYSLEDERGATVTSAKLPGDTGTLMVALPPSNHARNYVVRLRQAGPLGIAERAEPVTALASEGAPPLIEALSLDNANVDDGGSVTVRYKTAATHGHIAVRDASHAIWAQAPIARNGVTTLTLPRFGRAQELRVTLDVRQGAQRATSTLGLTTGSSTARASAPPAVPGVNPSSPIVVQERSVAAGGIIHAAIAAGATHVRLALETTTGTTLASVSVPDGASAASLSVPPGARGKLVLVATYDVGAGEESTVHSVTVE